MRITPNNNLHHLSQSAPVTPEGRPLDPREEATIRAAQENLGHLQDALSGDHSPISPASARLLSSSPHNFSPSFNTSLDKMVERAAREPYRPNVEGSAQYVSVDPESAIVMKQGAEAYFHTTMCYEIDKSLGFNVVPESAVSSVPKYQTDIVLQDDGTPKEYIEGVTAQGTAILLESEKIPNEILEVVDTPLGVFLTDGLHEWHLETNTENEQSVQNNNILDTLIKEGGVEFSQLEAADEELFLYPTSVHRYPIIQDSEGKLYIKIGEQQYVLRTCKDGSCQIEGWRDGAAYEWQILQEYEEDVSDSDSDIVFGYSSDDDTGEVVSDSDSDDDTGEVVSDSDSDDDVETNAYVVCKDFMIPIVEGRQISYAGNSYNVSNMGEGSYDIVRQGESSNPDLPEEYDNEGIDEVVIGEKHYITPQSFYHEFQGDENHKYVELEGNRFYFENGQLSLKDMPSLAQQYIPDLYQGNLSKLSQEELKEFCDKINSQSLINTIIMSALVSPQDGKVYYKPSQNNYVFQEEATQPEEYKVWMIDLDDTMPSNNEQSAIIKDASSLRCGLLGLPSCLRELGADDKKYTLQQLRHVLDQREKLTNLLGEYRPFVEEHFPSENPEDIFDEQHIQAFEERLNNLHQFLDSEQAQGEFSLLDVVGAIIPSYRREWDAYTAAETPLDPMQIADYIGCMPDGLAQDRGWADFTASDLATLFSEGKAE
ncbi:MAG: hypothetical protein ACQEP8_01210 [Chlamydiota bacterium]